jgi:hypothetical protein
MFGSSTQGLLPLLIPYEVALILCRIGFIEC